MFEEFLDRTLGTCRTDTLDLELIEDMKPILFRPYPGTKVHEEIFKNEVERVFLLGVFEVANDSVWGSSSCVKPKP